MPSLFVWKATSPLTTSTITYYSGSNWFLEEHSTYSKSAMYLNQQSLSNHGRVYDIKWMPTNWVGSHLLENVSVPYALIKEDILGRLEQFGDWMRFTTYREVDEKEAEWKRIQQWVITPCTTDAFYEPCLINLSPGQTSLPIYNTPFQRQRQQPYQQRQQLHQQPYHQRTQPYQKKRISA